MGLRSDSVAGVRFLAAVHVGRGIKPAARSVGIHPNSGYRLLRRAFLTLRSQELDAEAAQSDLGCFTIGSGYGPMCASSAWALLSRCPFKRP